MKKLQAKLATPEERAIATASRRDPYKDIYLSEKYWQYRARQAAQNKFLQTHFPVGRQFELLGQQVAVVEISEVQRFPLDENRKPPGVELLCSLFNAGLATQFIALDFLLAIEGYSNTEVDYI